MEYKKGYYDALDTIDKHIVELTEIHRRGGVVDTRAMLNDLIYILHFEKSKALEIEEDVEEANEEDNEPLLELDSDALELLLNEVGIEVKKPSVIKFSIIKGGK